ncbi:Protein BATH-36 [Aphelenchoides avenae]|nr:Protein BATH-36 [Aphelenchus avenae]
MPRQVTLTFEGSERAVATFCTHDGHLTVAELIRCAVQKASFLYFEDSEFDVVSCDAQVVEGVDVFVRAALSECPNFPNYRVEVRMRSQMDLASEKDVDSFNRLIDCSFVDFTRPSLADVAELPLSDVTICVGEETVRTNRGYLSVYSTYFSEVFGSHSTADGEVAGILNGIGATDFAEFLLAVYPNSKALDESNVTLLAKMSDRFGVATLMERCVLFLLTSKIALGKKLALIDRLSIFEPFRKERGELLRRLSLNDVALMLWFGDVTKLSGGCQAELFGLYPELLL